MNLPKFIKDDERLFRLLLGDLFPSLELPVPEYGALQVIAFRHNTFIETENGQRCSVRSSDRPTPGLSGQFHIASHWDSREI